MSRKIENLIVDTTAFIQNAPLQEIANSVYTVQEVVNEITNKRQLRRLVVLPYDLIIKDVFPENVRVVTDFSKKTGDYPSLSATDIKVMALTYQLEKEKIGTSHLRTEPLVSRPILVETKNQLLPEEKPDIVSGFYLPNESEKTSDDSDLKNNELAEKFAKLECNESELDEIIETDQVNEILAQISDENSDYDDCNSEENDETSESDDDSGWITPSNVQKAKKQINDDQVDDKQVIVACITTDFAMQNVMKQMNLNVAALDGRMIKYLKTFILRCHTCFKTTSLMEKVFCPKCGNKTLKRVAVSLDSEGKMKMHINTRRPLTARGKKFSLPTFKGGKHANNPILTEDQPMPRQMISRKARMRTDALAPDYTAGYSPFVMRDIDSRSAMLGIRANTTVKHWMKRNPNERQRKKK